MARPVNPIRDYLGRYQGGLQQLADDAGLVYRTVSDRLARAVQERCPFGTIRTIAETLVQSDQFEDDVEDVHEHIVDLWLKTRAERVSY